MDNIKFVRYERNNDRLDLYFQICDRLAYNIRKHTQYDEEQLRCYLGTDNLFKYTINCAEDDEDIVQPLIEGIEKISNAGDDEHLYNHVLTDEGYPRGPRAIHELMYNEYGYVDIEDSDGNDVEQQREVDLEWWTAHFFIHLRNIMFMPTD